MSHALYAGFTAGTRKTSKTSQPALKKRKLSRDLERTDGKSIAPVDDSDSKKMTKRGHGKRIDEKEKRRVSFADSAAAQEQGNAQEAVRSVATEPEEAAALGPERRGVKVDLKAQNGRRVESGRVSVDEAKLKKKLHHTITLSTTATKRARTFEVQKQIKRLKQSGSTDGGEEGERELKALKNVDAAAVAASVLLSKLSKARMLPRPKELAQLAADKEVAEQDQESWPLLRAVLAHAALRSSILDGPKSAKGDDASSKDGAMTHKAVSKVSSNKTLADEIKNAVETLQALLGITGPTRKGADSREKPSSEASKAKDGSAKSASEKKVKESDPTSAHEDAPNSFLEREWSGASEEEGDEADDAHRDADAQLSSDEEDEGELDEEEAQRRLESLGDLSQFDGLVGHDSDDTSDADESEAEAGPSQGGESQRRPDNHVRGRVSPIQPSQSDTDSDEDEDEDHLPSLRTGFIGGKGLELQKNKKRGAEDDFSGEEDDADGDWDEMDEIDEHAEDRDKGGKVVKPARKNRRGQRERRKIWEKKFGRNANHIKVKQKESKAVSHDWTPARAPKGEAPSSFGAPFGRHTSGGLASKGRQRPAPFQAPPKVDGGWGVGPGSQRLGSSGTSHPYASTGWPANRTSHPAARKPQASEKVSKDQVHPSWAAKQQAKDAAAKALAGAGAGKKIVFD
ncbi:SRF-DEPENDENT TRANSCRIPTION REGULATION ASSOCIATED PROTEIN [Ceraceosorus bombacis]|uniref:SRF-DEPENDENT TRANSCRIPTION REGULATION ASSOCIATED PROTEIN n=1 Tax=Ceraceosorus bombacis TaxID=401625 RepID=A0A0P1BRK0_9BASI|nr:SRF-DEPENDENT TRANSCRIPTION REGULATION ASSOCIATED PROTEIN [Ceraceosorus bombacis]